MVKVDWYSMQGIGGATRHQFAPVPVPLSGWMVKDQGYSHTKIMDGRKADLGRMFLHHFTGDCQ